MKYLVIKNKGLIVPQDITLLGSSSKRGNDTKIGQFGTGNKFALSWLLRNNTVPTFYSGTKLIDIECRMTEHRGHPREIIYINGENTNITTEFGMLWTCWMALREFISNAIDEGEESINVGYISNVNEVLEENKTTILIPYTDAVAEVFDNFQHYFAFEREPDYISAEGMLYLKLDNSPVNIYRKGIRCFDSKRKTMLDFNFNHIQITEDRLIEGGEGTFDEHARGILTTCSSVDILKAAIKSDYYYIMPDKSTFVLSEYWIAAYKELLSEGVKFTTSSMKSLLGIISNGTEIPAVHFNQLIKLQLISNPIEAIFTHLDFLFKEVEGPSREVEKILSRFGASFKVYFGEMDTFMNVKVKNDEFYIKSTQLNKAPDTLAAMCIKEHSNSVRYIADLLVK